MNLSHDTLEMLASYGDLDAAIAILDIDPVEGARFEAGTFLSASDPYGDDED